MRVLLLGVCLLGAACGGQHKGDRCAFTFLGGLGSPRNDIPGHYFDPGVAGVPEVVHAGSDTPSDCFSCRVADPDGGSVACTVSGSGVVQATFTPSHGGVYQVDIGRLDGGVFAADLSVSVPVYGQGVPDVLLTRPCTLVTHAQGHVGCDETLYRDDGQEEATLDGGVWLGAGGLLLNWQPSQVSVASLSDAGVGFGPGVPLPRPSSVSAFGPWVAVSSDDGGQLMLVDGGMLTPLASVVDGDVDVLANGAVIVFRNRDIAASDGSHPEGGGVVECADQRGAMIYRAGNPPSALCAAPLIDGGEVGTLSDCCRCPDSCLPSVAGSLHRRGIGQTIHGVRAGDQALFLDGAVRVGVGDDFVWQSSDTQTAIWFQ